MAAVAYTRDGIVSETDLYPTFAFSADYFKANVNIGDQSAVTVTDADTYRITGATRDGRIVWNLLYKREGPSWFAANNFSVAAESWQLMSWLLYMPRASVSGTLTVDGKKYNVKASGYHDHNWGEWKLNGVTWNWAQYSEPNLNFELGDFPNKPGGIASIELNGQRFLFDRNQYTLTHTKWAYDPANNVFYPTQSAFAAANGTAQVSLVMDVQQTSVLSLPTAPPRAVIYEQTAGYSGQVSVNGQTVNFRGDGFKEYTAVVQ